jgi:hypothetical protein
MTDPQLQAWLDQEDEHVTQTIRKHGLFIQYVAGDRNERPPTFAYTVGLFGLGHPELVVLSTDEGTALGLLNRLGDRVRAGDNLVAGQLLSFEEWPHRVTVEEVPTRARSCCPPTGTTSGHPRRRWLPIS